MKAVQSITRAHSELLPGVVGLKCQAHAEIGEQTTIARVVRRPPRRMGGEGQQGRVWYWQVEAQVIW